MDDVKNNEDVDNTAAVTSIQHGLAKQHFINISFGLAKKGDLYKHQLVQDNWKSKTELENEKKEKEKEENQSLFSTEVDDDILEKARQRLLNSNGPASKILLQESWESPSKEKLGNEEREIEKVKTSILKQANSYYEQGVIHFNNCEFEQSVLSINKALNLNAFNLQYHLLKCEAFIQLGDIKSAIMALNKLLSLVVTLSIETADNEYEVLKSNLSQKLAFCYYLEGQTFYDCKYYLESLDCFTKASELRPNYLPFRIRSVSCLVALNRNNEALAFVNKIIEESEETQQNVHLYVLRARLHLKYNNQTLCYYDLRDALLLEPNHEEATHLMKMIEDAAEQLRNSCLILSLSNRLTDSLNKINGAIAMNPAKAEYNLQRGILYKRIQNFNGAIDEFILGLDKIDHNPTNDPELFKNLQRQILLTYNDFGTQCFHKRFYDESILLLNKAIRLEKNEKGLYLNRGDCFFKKNDYHFALADYQQAKELDPTDTVIKNRIAKVNYLYGVQEYDEKNYQEANKQFTLCIKNAPSVCKYYISRARTYYLQELKEPAQIDICVSILLDPTNQEIPTIIGRLFENQNLNDVMHSVYMKKANDYLEKLNIQGSIKKQQLMLFTQFNNKEDEFSIKSLHPNEEESDLELIEQKKLIKKTLKNPLKIDLKSKDVKILPLPSPDEENAENRGGKVKYFKWRKFNSGIASNCK